MSAMSFAEVNAANLFADAFGDGIQRIRKPVSSPQCAGYALGGGCELAMACAISSSPPTPPSSASPRSIWV